MWKIKLDDSVSRELNDTLERIAIENWTTLKDVVTKWVAMLKWSLTQETPKVPREKVIWWRKVTLN